MSPAYTATPPRTLGGCLHCATGQPRTAHDTTLPAATRVSIRATRR